MSWNRKLEKGRNQAGMFLSGVLVFAAERSVMLVTFGSDILLKLHFTDKNVPLFLQSFGLFYLHLQGGTTLSRHILHCEQFE